jgi:hypothetical protein
VRLEIDAVADTSDDYTFMLHIDSDHVANMDRLVIVVAHS